MSGTGKSQGVRVAVRTRPTASFATDYIKVSGDSVSIKMPKRESHGSDNAKDQWSWKFDKVLHNSSQEVTYNDVALPVVQSVLQGYNGTIMCYGQTGAGKTYTQLGGTSAYEYRGVQPRAIAEIFNYVNDSPQFDATIGVSYLEIYNDTLVDLLASLPSEETYKVGPSPHLSLSLSLGLSLTLALTLTLTLALTLTLTLTLGLALTLTRCAGTMTTACSSHSRGAR